MHRDIPIARPEAKWTQDDFNIMELNTKSRYTLTCALTRNEYNKICRRKKKQRTLRLITR